MEGIREKIPLPESKNAVEVFADFLQYLFRCSRTYIEEVHAIGDNWWGSMEDTIDFVLSHPNGWEGAQQEQMRRAAVLAGLVPDDRRARHACHLLLRERLVSIFASRMGCQRA